MLLEGGGGGVPLLKMWQWNLSRSSSASVFASWFENGAL